MKYYFTLVLYFIFHVTKAQVTFQKTFGSPNTSIPSVAYDLTSDFEFNYYTIGTSFGNIFVTKIDSLGNILWSKSYLRGNGLKIFATSDSNLVMVSQAALDFSGNAYLSIIKIDTTGMIIWGKNYLLGGSMALNTVSIVELNNHDLLIGSGIGTYNLSTTQIDFTGCIIKTDNSGNLKWMKTTDPAYNLLEYNLIVENDNSYFITGDIDSIGFGKKDILIMNLDSAGNIVKSKIFGNSNIESGIEIIKYFNNGLLLIAIDRNNLQQISQPHFIRLDDSLNVLWNKKILIPGNYYPTSISTTSDSGFIISGNAPELMKIDSTANCQWWGGYGTSGFNVISWKVLQTKDNGYISCGTIFATTDVSLIKTNSIGYTGCFDIVGTNYPSMNPLLFDSVITINLVNYIPPLVIQDSISNFIYADTMYCREITSLPIKDFETSVFQIYPNPAIENFVINLEYGEARHIEIYNSFGLKIKDIDINESISEIFIDCKNWPCGFYLCKVFSLNQSSYKKIVKQ